MPKKCFLCKEEPYPLCGRSFHRLPKNESARQKWLDAIKLSKTPNLITTYICSDHFDEDGFFDSDEFYRQRRRLRPNAIPKLINQPTLFQGEESEIDIKSEDLSTDEVPVSSADATPKLVNQFTIFPRKENEIYIKSEDLSTDEVPVSIADVTPKLINQLTIFPGKENEIYIKCEDLSTDEVPVSSADVTPKLINQLKLFPEEENEIYIKSEDLSTDEVPVSSADLTPKPINQLTLFQGGESEIDNKNENHSTDAVPVSSKRVNHVNCVANNQILKKKRKLSSTNVRPVKKLRFKSGFQTEYMCPEDFVNEEGWNKFLRYVVCQETRMDAAYNKISTERKKVKRLTNLISTLKQREEFDPAEYLKDLPTTMKELLVRVKEGKSTAPFSENLTTFARTLHSHSPAAYEMVRSSFLNCLPCTQTLNSWKNSNACTSEISEEIIDNVADIVKIEKD